MQERGELLIVGDSADMSCFKFTVACTRMYIEGFLNKLGFSKGDCPMYRRMLLIFAFLFAGVGVGTGFLPGGVAAATEEDFFASKGYEAAWVAQTQSQTYDQHFYVEPCDTIYFSATFENTGSKTWHKSGEEQVAFNIYKDPAVISYPSTFAYLAGERESYFAHESWLTPFRVGILGQESVAPGELGTVEMQFSIPCSAEPGRYREDISMAVGPHWMPNPTNGDPLGVAHIWIGFVIQERPNELDHWLGALLSQDTNPHIELVTLQQQQAYNEQTRQRLVTATAGNSEAQNRRLVDLKAIADETVSQDELLRRILGSVPPALVGRLQAQYPAMIEGLLNNTSDETPCMRYYLHDYGDNSPFSDTECRMIGENFALSTLPDQVNADNLRYAVVTAATDIRSVPSNFVALSAKNLVDDSFQETKLDVGDVVIILHEGERGFFFVQSEVFAGWTYGEHLAFFPKSELPTVLVDSVNDEFVVITKPEVSLLDSERHLVSTARMGSRFILREEREAGFTIAVPTRGMEGELVWKEALVAREQAHQGYMPLTLYNLFSQLLGWYGKGIPFEEGTMDAAEFVRLTYRVFGSMLPRKAQDFPVIAGSEQLDVASWTAEEKLSYLRTAESGTILGWDDHVLLLFGVDRHTGEPIVMHLAATYQRYNDSECLPVAAQSIMTDELAALATDDGEKFLDKVTFITLPR